MATTIASGLAIFSDGTGHSNQGLLQYAATQARWWLLVTKTKTATVVSTYVSSSSDPSTATWSASTDSGAFPSTHALNSGDHRQLGAVGFANGSTDVVHVSVGINNGGTSGLTLNSVEHIRATFTGASSITWESWAEFSSGNGGSGPAVIGNSLGYSTAGRVHEVSCMLSADFSNGYPTSRLATNNDTTSTWTSGFAAVANPDSQPNFIAAYAFAPLASDGMLIVYGNGGAAQPNTTGLRSNIYSSGSVWPTTGSVVTGNGTTTQDQMDFGLRGVDTTHIFCVRRSGSNTFDMQMHNGSSWSSKTSPPNQNHLAGSGIFLATNGTDLWMVVIDSAANGPIMLCKYTVSTNLWGAWSQVEAAGSAARNAISGYPNVVNNKIGIIFTEVNGANFDIKITVADASPVTPVVTTPDWSKFPKNVLRR